MIHCNFLIQLEELLEHNDFLTAQSQRLREFYKYMAEKYPFLAFTFKGRIKSLVRAEEKFNGKIPEGFEIQVRPRSGLAAKNGITVLNTPGTIDSDYRGELKIILINLGNEDFTVQNGDRIAQIIVSPVIQGNFIISNELSQTDRGSGGFGSTGRN